MSTPNVSALVAIGTKGRTTRDESDAGKPMTFAFTLKKKKIGMNPVEMYEIWKECFGGSYPAQTLELMIDYAIQKKKEEAGVA